MNIYWIFLAIIGFCIYILFGLHMIEGMETTTQIIMTWVIYTILWATFITVFSLGYFWSVIRNKTGPYGLKGPQGESGVEGSEGECSITASQAYCMKSINDYINNLYKSNTNKDILNEDTQKFPCIYLNEKIQKMANSRQYQVIVANLSNENKGIDSVVNYLKSIWKEWFDLIYNATNEPGVWFIDEFGDENYKWVGNNPFDEIKKYDIYYWGITRDFRPLKAEICRSSSTYNNSKFPQQNLLLEPRLKIIQSNNYKFLANDKKTGAYFDASWWRPQKTTINNETYYPVGDVVIRQHDIIKGGNVKVGDLEYSQPYYTGPDIKTILVAGDVKDPIKPNLLVWHDADFWFGSYKSVCPEGYSDMGNIVISHKYDIHSAVNDKIKCVPTDCIEQLTDNGHGLWEHNDNWQYVINDYLSGNNEATGSNGYNLMRTSNSGQPFYKIKDKCLVGQKSKPPSTKDVEPDFSDLGIGWNGHPYKLDPKYSIFSFLNLVPEGMIVNKATGQRFYITHYGGEDVNIYNILVYDKSTNKFNYALQTTTVSGSKETFADDTDNGTNTGTNTGTDNGTNDNPTIFSIAHTNGKFISYDNNTKSLSLNKGNELFMDIEVIPKIKKTKDKFENTQEDTSLYSKDNYFINKAYYIENDKPIHIDTFLNIQIDNNTKAKTNWNIIDNPDGSVKIVNNSGKYIGYDDNKDTIILVSKNNKKNTNWFLNHF